MVIDIHQHLDQRTTADLDPAAVEAHARLSGVDLMLVSNRAAAAKSAGGADRDETDANAACLAAGAACPCLAPLYWVRAGQFDSNVHAFTGALSTEPFVAAVFAPLLNGFDARDHELLGPYLAVLAQLNRSAIFHVGTTEPASVENTVALARRHAGLPMLLCDAPRDRGWVKAVDAVRRVVQRGDAQIYLGTAGAHPEEVRLAAEALGPKTLLFGSGGTILNKADAQRCRKSLDELRQKLSPADFEQITAANARRLFGLALPQAP